MSGTHILLAIILIGLVNSCNWAVERANRPSNHTDFPHLYEKGGLTTKNE